LDYKTSKRYGPYLPEDYYRQLIIYAFLYTLEMGDMPNFVGVNYLRFDDTFYVKVNQGVLDEAKEVIEDLKSNPIPNYYIGNTYGYEARKVCEDWNLSYNVGTAVTYLLRSSYKHDSPYDCIQKAINHLNFELDKLNNREQ